MYLRYMFSFFKNNMYLRTMLFLFSRPSGYKLAPQGPAGRLVQVLVLVLVRFSRASRYWCKC